MLLTIHLLSIVIGITSGKLSCLDEEGEPVDMYILYKLPEITWYNVPHVVSAGKGYVYLDSNDLTFRFGNNSIGSSESPPGRTLNQVYKKHYYFEREKKMNKTSLDAVDDMAHVFYNDANPEGHEFFEYGHTKGALSFDDESGFWLLSSVPKYPFYVKDGYGYPNSGRFYGQMMMCITFKSSVFDDIGLQLLYNNPHVHDANLPESWKESYPNLEALLKGEVINDSFLNIGHLESIGGYEYLHFAKSGAFQKDLYFDLVAPTLNSDLICETWQHGESNIGPSCLGTHVVGDVLKVNISVPDELTFSFKNYNDHSKFAIANSQDNPYVCVGDINRQTTQYKRGGGTMCVSNSDIWWQFQNVIGDYTRCGKDEL